MLLDKDNKMINRRDFIKGIFLSPTFADLFLKDLSIKKRALPFFNAGVYPLSGKYSYIGRYIKIIIEYTNYLIKIENPLIAKFFEGNFKVISSFLDDKSVEFMDTILGIKLNEYPEILFVHGSYASNLTEKLKYSCYISKLPLINFISTASNLTNTDNAYFVRTCASNSKIIFKLIYDFIPKNFMGNFALLHAPNTYGFDVFFNLKEKLMFNSLKKFFVFYQPVTDLTNLKISVEILKKKEVNLLISALYLQDFKKLLKYLHDVNYYPVIVSLTYAYENFLKDIKNIFNKFEIYYVDHRGSYLKDDFLKLNETFKLKTGLTLDTNLARVFQGYLIALYPLSCKIKSRKKYIKILKNIYVPKDKLFLDWDDVVFENSENIGAKVEFKRWILT